jgi:hypothetical protein
MTHSKDQTYMIMGLTSFCIIWKESVIFRLALKVNFLGT